jgi:methylase of polypeptide subunit release factors
VETLGSEYERLLESGARHANGVYYTPRHIVDTIVERTLAPLLAGATPERALQLRVLDPACGSGAFLLGAARYLMDWHLKQGKLRLTLERKREILTSCLYGVDLDAQAVELAQRSLNLELLQDEAEVTADFSRNIRCGNSLIFDWNARTAGFGEIVLPEDEGGRGGFDAIIGNPPYIRVQALRRRDPSEAELYKRLYRTAQSGNYDLYLLFIEKSLRLLRSSGRMGLIIPTKWWQASYGAALRALLKEGQHYAETIDFAHEQVFEDPTSYTCISLFTKTAAPELKYQRVSPGHLHGKPLWQHEVSWALLDSGPWYLGVRSSVRRLFERLSRSGPFLGDEQICPRVFQGLKTSLDAVYVLDVLADEGAFFRVRSKALGEELSLEKGPLQWIVKGAQMKRFAPLRPRKAVLVPYEVTGNVASLIPPKRFKEQYPRVWSYLLKNREALEQRERGRMKRDGWYAYIYPKNLSLFRHRKLLTADMANQMNFSLDAEGAFHLLGGAAGGYGLLPAKPEYAAPLLALLNSKLLEWMLRPPGFSSPFRGGWFSCEARFINLLPIRLPGSPTDMNSLGALALRAVEAWRKHHAARSERDRDLAARQIEALESEIDDRVFALYEVTPDERRQVEKLLAEARAASSGAEPEEGSASAE